MKRLMQQKKEKKEIDASVRADMTFSSTKAIRSQTTLQFLKGLASDPDMPLTITNIGGFNVKLGSRIRCHFASGANKKE